MIVTGFKTVSNVIEYLETVEEYTDWKWMSWNSPTNKIDWEHFFTKYQRDWWFHIDYKDRFWYWIITSTWKYDKQINYKKAILKLKWETMKEWDMVYVCNISEGSALRFKTKRILLKKCNNWYVCVNVACQSSYERWDTFDTLCFKYAVPIPKVKEYTMEQLQEKLWESFKIIK